MNKKTKGVSAAAAASALLLGGAGSLAYWSDQETVSGANITSGALSLQPAGAGTWKDGTGATIDTTTFKIVPGDTLTYTATYTVEAAGNNLQANLTADTTSITGTLVGKVTTTVTATIRGTTTVGTTAVPITGANNGDQIAVSVAIDFPFGTVVDNTSQKSTLDLTGLKVSLVQIDNPGA
ncbi:alternate-type signal peptide domain-containing protein [Williamsia sp. CHRR-6]|uniref:alternate-type signal peptide domain-containing protein n=1 Tax=Williamsia sp. CHRR-6 TaxID=2835871 RepID=UPI001BDAD7A3|nr:alternate-type signal peptide domain-containing protein [Williamsia sp. CHRR-6]MBT0568284.1 alternate-type signal peptide domain-containing protein [Williamsia sp. CHRR-6]